MHSDQKFMFKSLSVVQLNCTVWWLILHNYEKLHNTGIALNLFQLVLSYPVKQSVDGFTSKWYLLAIFFQNLPETPPLEYQMVCPVWTKCNLGYYSQRNLFRSFWELENRFTQEYACPHTDISLDYTYKSLSYNVIMKVTFLILSPE